MNPTLFISDLHLDPRRPAALVAFRQFLDSLQTENCAALYILGDLFEAWIGDDEDQPELREVVNQLASLSARGVPLYFMHGNRDFLIGETFATASGCTLLSDPTVIELDGRRILLLHGDTLCTDDQEYQQFRTMVRNPQWQQMFLQKSLAERRQIAAQLRETSREQTGRKAMEIMDANPQAVDKVMRDHGIDCMIHGHTHRPGMHAFEIDGQAAKRIVLGDWYDQGSVLRWDADGPHLQTLPLPDA